jgi:hypothetical protein
MRAKELPMIPYDADPSLYTVEPLPAVLDDGFSPPPQPPLRQADRAGVKPQDSVDASLAPPAC